MSEYSNVDKQWKEIQEAKLAELKASRKQIDEGIANIEDDLKRLEEKYGGK